MSKQIKEDTFFADDILEGLKQTGVYVCSPICKHCVMGVIDAVTEKYPDVNITMNYIDTDRGLYNLFISLVYSPDIERITLS